MVAGFTIWEEEVTKCLFLMMYKGCPGKNPAVNASVSPITRLETFRMALVYVKDLGLQRYKPMNS